MSDIIFQIPVTIKKVETTVHKSLKIVINTQENLTVDEIQKVLELHDQLCWGTFVKRKDDKKIQPDDLMDLPALSEYEDTKKTSSERLRNVLFVFYTKSGGKKENFEQYRLKWMEKKIDEIKEIIPEG